jgi:hypothetical protein
MASTTGLTAQKTMVCGEQGHDASLQYRGGKSKTMMMAASLSGSNGRVWEVAGGVGMHGAENEVKRRTVLTGRDDALARSGRVRARAGVTVLTRARLGVAIARLLLANGLHDHDQ